MTTTTQHQPDEDGSISETESDARSQPFTPRIPAARRIRVWVSYNPTTGEAILFDQQPLPEFGRRQGDMDPIELDLALVKEYATTKEIWYGVHAKFTAAVKAAHDRALIDWE
jgi:hypothetical protein